MVDLKEVSEMVNDYNFNGRGDDDVSSFVDDV